MSLTRVDRCPPVLINWRCRLPQYIPLRIHTDKVRSSLKCAERRARTGLCVEQNGRRSLRRQRNNIHKGMRSGFPRQTWLLSWGPCS